MDNWFDVIVKRQCGGECYLIRYCDDFVCCFQKRYEVEVFKQRLEERFRKYGLELAEEKTKILEFGRFAGQNRKARGEGKPDTFDFLGFTFYCGMDGKKRFYRCKVKTSKKKFRSKIKAMKEWIKSHRTMPLEQLFKVINEKLRGHYQYYGVTDNTREVKRYLTRTKWLLLKWLNRRSQRRSYTHDTFFKGVLRTFPLLEPESEKLIRNGKESGKAECRNYFCEERLEMANLKLKKTILEIVENQMKANDPPCTKDTYEKLVNAGYSKSEAKDKIGAVVLTEIYDILKEGQAFDEEKYKNSLEEMLKQSIDYEDDHHIETEWDAWDDLVQKGYEYFLDQRAEEGMPFWQEAWDVFESAMKQVPEKVTLYALMESQDYVYSIDGWLQDYEMELGNAGKYGERIAFCQRTLELFEWRDEDDSCFRCGIGESLFREGKVSEAIEYYENWLKDDPQNVNGINSFSWILSENGDDEKAYEVIRKVTWGVSCYMDNSFLFMRARQLAEFIGKEDESKWYQNQLDKFENSLKKWEMDEDEIFDEFTAPKKVPVVKDKKIYLNDPCPCGSGKKYKKCCGKK